MFFAGSLVEHVGHKGKEEWPGNRPEGCFIIMIQNRLGKGKQGPHHQNQFHKQDQNRGPSVVLKGYKRLVIVLLLKERKGPYQEHVRCGTGNVGHVRQNRVEALGR